MGVCLPQGLHSPFSALSHISLLGPELVVCILATVSYCTCIPINPSSTEDEIRFELRNAGAKAVIYVEEGSAHIRKVCKERKIGDS